MAEIIWKDNENTISIGDDHGNGVSDVDGNYINNASVVLTALKDAAGATVAGGLTMTYKAASNGVYRCKLPDTLALVAGANYTAIIDATSGTDNGHWEIPCVCRIRTS